MVRKKLELRDVINIGIQVADALDYAHKKGVVHRDIKPSNIIVQPNSQLKITDFGIAHIEDPSASDLTQAGEILGTPAYMSPEQVLSRQVDGRSDIFSLGVILYELSTGVRPFTGVNLSSTFNAITQMSPRSPASINSAIPQRLSQVILKCLMKKPEERFPTSQSLVDELKGCFPKEEKVIRTTSASGKRIRNILLLTSTLILAIFAEEENMEALRFYSILTIWAVILFMSSSCTAIKEGQPSILNGYGVPVKYGEGRHPGIDYATPTGTPIIAASDGIVLWVGDPCPKEWYCGGYFVRINHGRDYTDRLFAWYAHFSKVFVNQGDSVKRGQLIGLSGANNEGIPHLHFAILKTGYGGDKYSMTENPNKYWLDGSPHCYDPNKDYSNYSSKEITIPVACGKYSKTLLKSLKQ